MGISTKLPVRKSSINGFESIDTIQENIKQNLKMLLLTRPGERLMDPSFGVGVDTFLFENFTEATYSSIQQRTLRQVAIYMPQITIKNIFFDASQQDSGILNMRIQFNITPLGTTDVLDLPVSNGGSSGAGLSY